MQKLMTQSTHILGVRIDKVTFDEAYEMALTILNGKKSEYFTTPNSEIVLKANNDPKYLSVLNKSKLNIPDGTGLLYASLFNYITQKDSFRIKHRVTGTDLAIKLLKKNKSVPYSIFLLGASEESNKKTKEFAEKNGSTVAGTFTGDIHSKECIQAIKESKADLLLVALSFPVQEKWIAENLKKIPNIKLAIGIGGAFDFISGNAKRAPVLMQRLGLEWLYRVIREPKRIKRIINAVIVFPLTFVFSSFSSKKTS